MLRKRIGVLLLSAVTTGLLTVGCGSSDSSSAKLSISGSTSIGPVIEKEAEGFKSINPDVSIEVNQLGSSAGIKDAINGVAEIGMASRDLKDEEKSSGISQSEMAIDGIGVITHKNNDVKSLTIDQVKDIYTGK